MMFNEAVEAGDSNIAEVAEKDSPFCLSKQVATRMLDKLCHDDAFRALFAADPRMALASLGDERAADPSVASGSWSCLHGDALPSKTEMRELRDSFMDQMVASMSQKIFHIPSRK